MRCNWLRARLPARLVPLWLCGAFLSPACTGTIGPGHPGNDGDTGAIAPLFISEIMYHPVLEEDFDDWHEFVEIHNPNDRDLSLDGWSLTGGIRYRFPADASIPANGYRVVARSRAHLLAVPAYALDQSMVLGDYDGSLDNGGDTVALQAPGGAVIDTATYDDAQPWPVAADALGAGESWLDSALLPLAQHRHMGHSLERVSVARSGTVAANWVASPLDGATPGRPNSHARDMPLAVVEFLYPVPRRDPDNDNEDGSDAGVPAGDDTRIRSDHTVHIHAHFGRTGALVPVVLEYFVDDVARSDEAVTSVALVDDGSGADQVAGDRIHTAALPPQPGLSIVRYRIHAADGSRPISPRPDEPFAWHAYFVEPDAPPGVPAALPTATDGEVHTPAYHLFIAPADWTSLWTNIEPGRENGCEIREEWNRKVPAVFVHEGKVYDVRVRHQGSRYNRTNGDPLADWPHPGPDQPAPVRALSWRIAFPRYARFEGRRVITLKKLKQSCPGLNFAVGFRLFAEAGLPTPEVRYAQLFINGGYYHYTLEVERPGEDMLQRYHESRGAADPAGEGAGSAAAAIGHLFKATGCNCDDGPYSWGDGRLIADSCGLSAAERYANTYDRKTHEWAGHDQLIALIEGLHAARDQGTDTLRAYLGEHFDVDLTLSHLAVMNWGAPFDDVFHNYYLYQRREDGKWTLAPWDLDLMFGGRINANASLYIGQEGDPDNSNGRWNYFKDAFLRAYRPEFDQRIKTLNQTILHPDQVKRLVDEVYATADPALAAAAPAGVSCSFEDAVESFKRFADERHQVVETRLP